MILRGANFLLIVFVSTSTPHKTGANFAMSGKHSDALEKGGNANLLYLLTMEKNPLLERPLWSFSGEEFLTLLRLNNGNVQAVAISEPQPERKLVYGIKGLCEILQCSPATAHRIKKSGILKDAITQIGRKIVIDVELAMEKIRTTKKKNLRWSK